MPSLRKKDRVDYKNLTWIEATSHQGGFFYYIPCSMTLIEHDEHFGRLLNELKQLDGEFRAEKLTGYPEGYVEDTVHNLEILEKRGLLNELSFPGMPDHVPLGRLIIANTMRCNLACRYCYNRFDFNTYGPREKDMSLKTFHDCAGFLEETGADLPFFEISFIGGEPLLHPEVLDAAAKWGEDLRTKGKDLYITATTNATLLSREMGEFCRERRIHLKLTLDGSREEHDRNRVFPGGEGTFDRITALLPDYFSTLTPKARYAATTINTRESDPRERVAGLFAKGFSIIDLVELYSTGRESEESGERLGAAFRDKYERMLDYLYLKVQERIYLHIIPVYDIVKNLHLRKPSFMRCRAGGDSLAVSPDGTIYACHHFLGDDRFELGTVKSALSSSCLSPFRTPVGERPGCSGCWAHLLCGGPCFHRSLALTGDAFQCPELECTRIKALIIEVMRFYIRLSNAENQSLDWFLEEGAPR